MGVAVVPVGQIVAGSDQPKGTPPDGSPGHLYTPPKKLVPRARVGGEVRGTDGTDPEVAPLAPDHVAFTVDKTPTVNWFLSKPTSHKVMFTFTDISLVRPLYDGPIPTPKDAGIHAVRLKDLGLSLETEVQYRWYVSVQRDPDSPSRDIVAGGMIERCDYVLCEPRFECNVQSVLDNARNGLWYDAMACLCSLIDASPREIQLRRIRAQLLRDVGLNSVADWDLRTIQSLNR
jgi:hypothetical protein